MQRNQPASTQDIRESGGEGNRLDWEEGEGRDVILSPLGPEILGTLDPQDFQRAAAALGPDRQKLGAASDAPGGQGYTRAEERDSQASRSGSFSGP